MSAKDMVANLFNKVFRNLSTLYVNIRMVTFENKRKNDIAKTFTCASTPEHQPTNQAFRMWQFTINFLYYFGVTPYKCVFCKNRQIWDLKSSKLQKVEHKFL